MLATSVAEYNNGLVVPNYLDSGLSTFINNTYASLTLPLENVGDVGYSSCSPDSNGNVWIAGYSYNVFKLGSDGNNVSYTLPSGAILTGTKVVSNIPYFVDTDGTLYTVSSGAVSSLGAFTHTGNIFLEALGNTLYTLSPSAGTVESYVLSGVFSSMTVSGITVPSVLTCSASGNYLAVSGTNDVVFPEGYNGMVSNTFSNGDNYVIGINKSSNTIDYYAPNSITNNTFYKKSTVSGSGAPEYISNTDNGLYIFVSDTTNGKVQIYQNALDNIDLDATFSISNCANVVPISNNAQALVCQTDTITPLIMIGTSWSVQSSLSFTNPTGGICVTNTLAIIGTTNGFSLLNYNGSSWTVFSTTSLPFTPTSFAMDSNSHIYMSGTVSGTSYISVVSGTSIIGQVSWSGSVSSIRIMQDQLFALDSSTNTVYGFELLKAINVKNSSTLNSVVFTQITPTSTTLYSLLPKTYFTNIPSSTVGLVLTFFGMFIYSTASTYQVWLTLPYTLRNCTQSRISVYNGSSWAITTSFNTNDTVGALKFDVNNNLWAVNLSNTLSEIDPVNGTILSSTTIAPYDVAQTNVPLGISAMIYSGTHLYGVSSLLNGIVEIF